MRSLDACKSRVLQLERGIDRFLRANDAGEMGNRDKAIAHLRFIMSQRSKGVGESYR